MEQSFEFSFQRFDVYRVAREALQILVREKSSFKGLVNDLGPQMQSAMLSVVVNIAEGAGRVTAADQRRHYAIALGSCKEVAACVDIASVLGVDEKITREVMSRLARVAQMLLKLTARGR